MTLGFGQVAGDETIPVTRVNLPCTAEREVISELTHAYLDWQVAEAMQLPHRAATRLADGTWAYAAHKRVRDGARVMMMLIPGLLRFDIEGKGDSFSFALRNLTRRGYARQLRESEMRPYVLRDGTERLEYQMLAEFEGGPRVRVVALISPYLGRLEHDHSTVALVDL